MKNTTAYLLYITPDVWHASVYTFSESGACDTHHASNSYSKRWTVTDVPILFTRDKMVRMYGEKKGDRPDNTRGPYGDLDVSCRWRRVPKCLFLKFLRDKGVTIP